MRGFRYLAVATVTAGLLAGPAVTAASAAPAAPARPAAAQAASGAELRGGATTVTTGPGIAAALLKNGIVPRATGRARESVGPGPSGPAVRFTFPVTGGRVTLSPLGGRISHRGGILFVNKNNGDRVRVSRFIVDLTHADLTGIVNGNPHARVPLFRLDLSHAKLAASRCTITARGIGLRLTRAAARALNGALGTRLFSAGLRLGTARTLLRL